VCPQGIGLDAQPRFHTVEIRLQFHIHLRIA
jgi:hypothetical protein